MRQEGIAGAQTKTNLVIVALAFVLTLILSIPIFLVLDRLTPETAPLWTSISAGGLFAFLNAAIFLVLHFFRKTIPAVQMVEGYYPEQRVSVVMHNDEGDCDYRVFCQFQNTGDTPLRQRYHSVAVDHPGTLRGAALSARDSKGAPLEITWIRKQSKCWDFYVKFSKPLGRGEEVSYWFEATGVTKMFPLTSRHLDWEPPLFARQMAFGVIHQGTGSLKSLSMRNLLTDSEMVSMQAQPGTTEILAEDLAPGKYRFKWE